MSRRQDQHLPAGAYVWGPGDSGVDELLCQIDPYAEESHAADGGGGGGRKGKPWFILTDAQGDVVSIVNGGGALGLNNQPSAASVAGQWTYSPYGEVLTYDALAAGGVHPAVVFGHKTLAVDRLDAPTLTWENESEPGAGDGSLFETQRLVPDGRLIAYARNRTLDTKRGRSLQGDPNCTGLAVLPSASLHGSIWFVGPQEAAIATRMGDGLSLFAHARGNPIDYADPLGLFTMGELGMTMGVQGLIGGILNGAITKSWSGALVGAAGGALSGGLGASVSAIGYLGKFAGVAGNLSGGTLLGGTLSYSRGNSLSYSAMEGLATGLLGGAVAGIADRFMTAAFSPATISQSVAAYLSRSGGRLGGSIVRLMNHNIASELENGGYQIIGGAGRAAEEWIAGPGGGKLGGTFVDITAKCGSKTLRIQTIDTLGDGITPTAREMAAAARIRAAFPGDELRLIPKR